ncbi:MAG TPA: SDR family NAD(P)-dependent oxidoreductase [Solirubrobacterales bacterium]|nr:SDR family NAD(P)-dependent oxidoreductase [Solirubrobacterales bacterium]
MLSHEDHEDETVTAPVEEVRAQATERLHDAAPGTVIVTGATSGLGRDCVRLLHGRPGPEVVLAVRDVARGAAILAELGAPERGRVLALDLASLASVEAFIDRLRAAPGPGPTALVCNAGVQVPSGLERTEDGIERTFGVNHLGHFALVTGLLDSLPPGSRVVVVASDTHDPGRHTGMPAPRLRPVGELAHPPEAPAEVSRRAGQVRYTTSKLCNVLFAYELQRRFDALRPTDRLRAVAFNPGLMPGSGLARDYGPLARLAWRHLLPRLPMTTTTDEAARHLAELAVGPLPTEPRCLYFDRGRPGTSSPESYDPGKAAALWSESEELRAALAGRTGSSRP